MKSLQTTNSETHLAQEVQFLFFSEYADFYIDQMQKGFIFTDKGVKFSPETIRLYINAVKHFKTFESLLNEPIKIYEMKGDVLKAFELYLASVKLAKTTSDIYISKILAIGNVLIAGGIAYQPIKFRKRNTEPTTKVYLSLNELRKVTNSEALKNSETQQKIWDIFLVQSFTALRYSTLCKFLENPFAYIHEQEGNSYIKIVADKTRAESVIPMSKTVYDIIMKYGGVLKPFSEQYMNRELKTICKLAGIDQPIPKRSTRGGKSVEELVEKWTMISTHTARRSFISIAKQYGLTNDQLMPISGHATEKQLLHYVRTSNFEKIEGIMDHDFFKLTI